jgi:hypothetical protein
MFGLRLAKEPWEKESSAKGSKRVLVQQMLFTVLQIPFRSQFKTVIWNLGNDNALNTCRVALVLHI